MTLPRPYKAIRTSTCSQQWPLTFKLTRASTQTRRVLRGPTDTLHALKWRSDSSRTFRLRVGCSASIWTAPDGSSLLTLGALSVQTAPDGYRRIAWMIKRMIKSIRQRIDAKASNGVRAHGSSRRIRQKIGWQSKLPSTFIACLSQSGPARPQRVPGRLTPFPSAPSPGRRCNRGL
jgi:hypothetical protein